MNAAQQTQAQLPTLASVLSALARLQDRVSKLELAQAAAGAAKPPTVQSSTRPTSAQAGGEVASDRDLDSEWGDPEVRKDPPRWDGTSYVGKHYSQTEPDYLDSLAGFLEWKASKNAEEGDPARAKYIMYDRRDAARARGWARRLRAKATAAPVAAPAESRAFGADEEIPF